MVAYDIFRWIVCSFITLMILSAPPIAGYCFFKYKDFREQITKMLVTDKGEKDGSPDKSDGKDFLMIFFGYIFSCIGVLVLLGWWLTGVNLWEIETASGTLSGMFFGISKWDGNKK